MKAILVIDIGDNRVEDIIVDELFLSHNEKDDYFGYYSKVTLKPMPYIKKHKGEIDYDYGYIDGWNDYYRNITGETE